MAPGYPDKIIDKSKTKNAKEMHEMHEKYFANPLKKIKIYADEEGITT